MQWFSMKWSVLVLFVNMIHQIFHQENWPVRMTHAQRVKIVVPITNLLRVVQLAKIVWVDFANK